VIASKSSRGSVGSISNNPIPKQQPKPTPAPTPTPAPAPVPTQQSNATALKSGRGSWWCLCGSSNDTSSSNNPNPLQSPPAPKPVTVPTPTQQQHSNQKYHCFLTHNWGNRQANGSYDNHERVRRIYQGLQSKGVSCWFDSERMTGTIQKQMSKGIDDSECVIGILLLFLLLCLF
jgi:hypothetical protein